MKTIKPINYLTMMLFASVISLGMVSCSKDDGEGGGSSSGITGWYASTEITTADINNEINSLLAMSGASMDSPYVTYFNSIGELSVTDNSPQTGNVHYARMTYKVLGLRFIQILDEQTMCIYSSGAVLRKGTSYAIKVYELEGNNYTGPLEVHAADGFYVTYKRNGNYLTLYGTEGETATVGYSNNTLILDGIRYKKISTDKH